MFRVMLYVGSVILVMVGREGTAIDNFSLFACLHVCSFV